MYVYICGAFQVNGNTLFMTGTFKEFKLDSHANDTWDEQNVMTSTAVWVFLLIEKVSNLSSMLLWY